MRKLSAEMTLYTSSDCPLVSIIIPCYNTEKYIAEAIDSALSQSYQPIEVIVIDDGSTDSSVEVIKTYSGHVRLEKNRGKGACAARNLGLTLSRGKYIQFLDADDVLVSDKIEKQVPYLESGAADLVFCKGFLFGDGKPIRPKKRVIASPINIDPFVYCLNQGLSTEGPLHRKSALDKIGGFDEALPRAQETDLHIRLCATNIKIMLLDELLYQHRNHDGPRITRTALPKDYMLNTYLKLAKRLQREDIYELTPIRLEALSRKIFQQSVRAFRNGYEDSAIKGFEVAKSLSSNPAKDREIWYKLLVRLVDPIQIEKGLKSLRKIRAITA